MTQPILFCSAHLAKCRLQITTLRTLGPHFPDLIITIHQRSYHTGKEVRNVCWSAGQDAVSQTSESVPLTVNKHSSWDETQSNLIFVS